MIIRTLLSSLCFLMMGISPLLQAQHLLPANANKGIKNIEQWTNGKAQILDENGLSQPLPNAMVLVTDQNGDTYYAISDGNGNFKVPRTEKNGDGFITVTPRQPVYYIDTSIIYSESWGSEDVLSVLVMPNQYCPFLYVDISAPYIQRCSNSYYSVVYRNDGTSTASGAYIDVDLDADLTLISSDIPATSLGNNSYRFYIGNVAVGASGSFHIDFSAACNIPTGKTHCTEAHIYPDEVCDSLWNGAVLDVNATCTGDSVLFMVHNSGHNYGTCPYVVIEDDIMLRQSSFPINSGETVTISVPVSSGSAYRMEVPQQNNFPSFLGDPIASVTIEGCGSNTTFQGGYVNQFSNGNSSPFIATDCQSNVDYTPAYFKQAFPQGYGTENYIYSFTDLDYHIYFESPTPSNVIVISDTISAHLDLMSLEPGASSHPYTWSIEPNRVVHFYLDNSALASTEGFVKYRFRQTSGNTNGTIISNQSNIRFGATQAFNTNQLFHTVGESFLQVYVASGDEIIEEDLWTLYSFPSPMEEAAMMIMEGEIPTEAHFQVFDLNGRSIIEQPVVEKQWAIHRSQFPASGVYFFQVVSKGVTLKSGKLMVK